MTHEFQLSAAELLMTLQQRRIPLPPEIGAFITLEVCESLLERPAKIDAAAVLIGETGEVHCADTARACGEAEAVAALIALLSEFLVCAAPAVPRMLIEVIERGPGHPERTLAGLLGELEACLMPLNRAATRRVIARLVREAKKAVSRQPPSQLLAAELDASFDALVHSQPAPPRRAAELDASFDALVHSQPAPPRRAAPDSPDAVNAQLAELRELGPVREPASSRKHSQRVREAARVDVDPLVDAETNRTNLGILLLGGATLVSLALLIGYFMLGGEGARAAQPHAAQPLPQRTAASRYGDLRVDSQPSRAQVLLLIGPGPALATDIPLGVALEFVAVADGYLPARAVVPADAVWDVVDGKARYELAMQEAPLAAGSFGAATRLGSTLLPRELGSPRAQLGSVRVVTTPRAAKVYQLVGFTPDVRVENVPLDRPYEILVYSEGRAPVSRHVRPEDFREQNGKRVAAIAVQLDRAPGNSG